MRASTSLLLQATRYPPPSPKRWNAASGASSARTAVISCRVPCRVSGTSPRPRTKTLMRTFMSLSTRQWRSRRTPHEPDFFFMTWRGWPIHWRGASSTCACSAMRTVRSCSTSRFPSTSTFTAHRPAIRARLLVIGRSGCVRLPDGAVFDGDPASGHVVQLAVGFIVKVAGQVFCRRVELDEWFEVIEHLVVDAVDDRTHDLLEQLEIQQQPGGVQFPAPQRQTNLVVVAMGVLTLAAIVAQVMSRGESRFDGYFIHGLCCPLPD